MVTVPLGMPLNGKTARDNQGQRQGDEGAAERDHGQPAEHGEGALGEIHHAGDVVDDHEAKRHDTVNRPGGDAGYGVLEEGAQGRDVAAWPSWRPPR